MSDAQPIRDILDELARCGSLLQLLRQTPSDNSAAVAELATPGLSTLEVDLLRRGPARARQSLLIAADSLAALARLMALPPHHFASAALSRTVIECSAIAFWLADRGLTVPNRVDRLLRVVGDDLEQERRISEAGQQVSNKVALVEAVAHSKAKATAFGEAVQAVGLTAKRMPPATDLVETVFGAGWTYRVESALMHGTPFAAESIDQMYSDEVSAGTAYVFVIHEAAEPYLRTVEECAAYVTPGEDEELRTALARTYEGLGFRDEFWQHLRPS